MKIDLAIYKTKKQLLDLFADTLPEMYGKNYDALADALTAIEEHFAIEFVNSDKYEQKDMLVQILTDVKSYNDNLNVTID